MNSADESPERRQPDADVVTEASALAALAHPLRLRVLGLLRIYGPSTATRLAAKCDTSPALISYHLRTLAEASFIVAATPDDLAGLSTHGRDRWWKAAARTTFTKTPPEHDPAALAAHDDFAAAVLALYTDRARSWLGAQHKWSRDWQEASTFSDASLLLTADETRELKSEMAELLGRYRRQKPSARPGAGSAPVGAALVAAQFLIFPDPEQDPPHDTVA
ncbi:helix-turn-helix domain-containing protein [Cryobacterium roopkundense]|uniref:DNA-binding transcriptional ArsR family regulator n=1 Tax=Cryobacterium roopkundense TaxID=1001240 RepID=A0A7W8ZSU8_9MICO|nr:helix-turn-helix domain-containing protein [Cryobacterium roopkundense]MBB5639566.1 DNA-binding transcriptional ArsR family regulator [Cryobacterium roopkundense]